MFLRIEKGSSTPISRQIAEQIASLIASDGLPPGKCLPSVRDLARQLAVNPNTVLRVYERLAREGLVELRQGQGTFVAHQGSRRAAEGHRARLLEELRGLVRQAAALGMDRPQIHALLEEALDQVAASSPLPAPEPTS
jgi:GntR family transcriptional regulator